MKKRLYFLVVILLIMNLTSLSLAQNQTEETTQKISLKPTLGFEYFSRTIKWDENKLQFQTEILSFHLFLGL